MKRYAIICGTLFALLLNPAVSAADNPILTEADSWLYQLQDANISEIAATDFDIVVIDYAQDGTDDTAYTQSQIQQLQDSGKIVLAYFSIGEAEDYRFYWDNAWSTAAPSWLGPENPDWAGNYKVKYWQAGWWDAGLQPYIDRINAAGFDGVYLDIIDGYDYWDNHGYGTTVSANRMVRLIKKVRKHLAADAPIVCPQNGESIIDDASKKYRTIYWRNIDCIGVEDLFYHSSKSDRTYRKGLLNKFSNHHKRILSVEYITADKYSQYLSAVNAQAFSSIPYRANPNRDLDTIVSQ
ncbi:MAG: MJ1477/TM1410 family putative glycoside hydrolase [Patescibacteria group bacterium]|jgi:cysteinyl-tRNA synthetase